MFDVWKWRFFRCFSEAAAAFREQLVADLESGQLLSYPRTLALLREMHERNRRQCRLYRWIDRPWLAPLGSFLDLCQRSSDEIAEHGFFRGARMEVERFRIALEVTTSDEAQRLFDSDEPILFIGNHPCIWGPDLWAVAASLERLCPKRRGFLVLTWTLVTALCPGLGPYSVPVVVTSRDIERFTHDEEGVSDDRPGASESLFRSWSPDIPVAQSRERTYAALQDMARRWVGGEHALTFPTGGAGTQALWFSGVGRVVRFAAEMLDNQVETDPHILFFRLEGASDYLLLSPPFVSRWHPARLAALRQRRRIAVHYAKTFRLRDWREQFLAMTNRSVARDLQAKFDGAPPRSRWSKHR